MTNAETATPAAVAVPGAHVAPAKTSSKKQATVKKGAPRAQKPAKTANPKKNASKPTKTAKQEARPRTGSKGEQVLELVARTNGASLAELMQATEWQAHSLRGFLSTASKKRGSGWQAMDAIWNRTRRGKPHSQTSGTCARKDKPCGA